jgi:sec-independent protein translocase protein TatC
MWPKQKKNSNSNSDADLQMSEMPLVAHLVELRNRLLKVVAVVGVLVLAASPFASSIYTVFALPLINILPAGSSMIATEVASPFFTPFKLTLILSIFVAIPFIFYQMWAFIAPGLYRHEKMLILPLLASSTILFYLGAAFAYFVVFPVVFQFLTTTAPEGVAVMTDISHYLDFILTMFFAFGFAFEVPIVIIVLVRMGIVTPEALAEKRSYVIVGAFVIGMLLTPPDVISQTLLAIPMILLFEAGLIVSRIFYKPKPEPEEEVAAEPSTEVVAMKDHYPPLYDTDPEQDADDEFAREFEQAQREERDLADKPDDAPKA